MRREAKEETRRREMMRNKFLVHTNAVRPRSGLWLRQWRLDHAITQEALAAALGAGLRTVKTWEKSDDLPRLLVLALEGR